MFHAEWEKRAFALTLAMGMPEAGTSTWARFARESLPPAEYLSIELLPDLVRGARTHAQGARAWLRTTRSQAGHSLHPPKPVKRILRPPTWRRRFIAAARPSASKQPSRSSRAISCARRTSIRLPIRGCRATCGATTALIERVHRLPRVSRQQRDGAGEDPQWLYTVVFDGANYGERTPTRRSKFPSTPGSPIWSRLDMGMRSAGRNARSGRRSRYAARWRRAGIPRAVGGRSVRDDARTARTRSFHLGNGPQRLPPKSSSRRRQAILIPARLITYTGSIRLRNWWLKKAWRRRTRCTAIAMPGTALATVHRTVSQSS